MLNLNIEEPSFPYYFKIVVPQQQQYTQGDTISGSIAFTLPQSYILNPALAEGSVLSLIVQLRCFYNSGEDGQEPVVYYERRKSLGTASDLFPPEGKLTSELREVPFDFVLGDMIQYCPPTCVIEELGNEDCGVIWAIGAWFEILDTCGVYTRLFHLQNERKVTVYPSPQDLGWKAEWELQPRTFNAEFYELRLLDMPVMYPQAPALFDVHLEINPSHSFVAAKLKVELGMNITVRSGNKTKRTFIRKETVGSVYVGVVWRRTVLAIKGCKIARQRPANFSSHYVDVVHTLHVVVERIIGREDHSVLVNVQLPPAKVNRGQSG